MYKTYFESVKFLKKRFYIIVKSRIYGNFYYVFKLKQVYIM